MTSNAGACSAPWQPHALLLVLLGAALLLLFATYTPLPALPRPRPAPLPVPLAAPAPTHNPDNTTTAAPSAPPAPPTQPALAAAPITQLAGELYKAGHERAHPELCPELGEDVEVLIMVTSAPEHARARDAVRLTWGHYAARRDVALVFMLGEPPAALRPALDDEDALYGDLVMGRFVDSYSNLTLKTLSMLEWWGTYCPRAPWLLKTDDDMFINVPRLLRFVAARANDTNTIWGNVMRGSPHRMRTSKYYVSVQEYPGAKYPPFVTGPAYVVAAEAGRRLLAAAPAERFLHLEDVFVTGVLATRTGVQLHHAPEFANTKVKADACTVQRTLSIHMVKYHEQFDLWRKLLDGQAKCPP